jgi:hypothetical protein
MTLDTILNPLAEMAYPAEFSMKTLLAQPSYTKKLAYAASHLEKIATGSARTVYRVDDDKVLKVAKNAKGLAQNKAEADWGTQHYEICAKKFETSEFGHFVEMELARRVTATKFKKILGFSIQELWTFLDTEQRRKQGSLRNLPPDEKEWMETMYENEWIGNLTSFIYDYDYPFPGDFGRESSYGIVSRPEGETIVLIDYGLNKEVLDTHYSHMR